jgi:hypothetical protein
VTRIDALGYKDHTLAGNGLDSDQDGGTAIALFSCDDGG